MFKDFSQGLPSESTEGGSLLCLLTIQGNININFLGDQGTCESRGFCFIIALKSREAWFWLSSILMGSRSKEGPSESTAYLAIGPIKIEDADYSPKCSRRRAVVLRNSVQIHDKSPPQRQEWKPEKEVCSVSYQRGGVVRAATLSPPRGKIQKGKDNSD